MATVSRSSEFPAYVGPPLVPDLNAPMAAGALVSSLVAAPHPSEPVGLTPTIDNGSPLGRVRELAEVLQRTREEVSAWGAEQTGTIREIGKLQHQIVEFREQVQSLQEQLDRARERHQQDESVLHDLENERIRLHELLSEVEPLRSRVAETDRLANELQERDCEKERLRTALGEFDRLLAARTLELDEARRHRDETRAQTEEERQAGRAEVERLRAEIEAARAAASRSDQVAEKTAGELSAVRDRLRDLRDTLDGRNAECAQLRENVGKLEEIRVDHELLLGEVEGYRSELRARDAELERLGDLSAELDLVRSDRERIDAERREGALESERLRGRLVEVERLLAEHDETRQRVEREWEELAELWSQERRELLDQAERQLGEERIRAKAELQGWQSRLNTASQHFARDLVSLRKEIGDLNQELETLRQEQDNHAVRAEAAAFEMQRSATHPDESSMLLRRREPISPIESDQFANALEEKRPETLSARPQRHTFDEGAPLHLDPEDPHRRTFPAWLSIVGSLIVVAIGLLPFWVFEITWESYVVSSLLILVGVMVLGFLEGRYTGQNPILRALQMALVVAIIIAAVLLIGPRVLETSQITIRLPGLSKTK